MTAKTLFSGDYIERSAGLRRDPAALERAWADPEARFVPVWESQCLIRDGQAARLNREELGAHLVGRQQAVFLGLEGERPLFAFALECRDPPSGLGEFAGLRELISHVPRHDAGMLGYARAVVGWQRQHRFCGRCGSEYRAEEGGFVMACSAEECGHRSYPRLDPAIIVLVHQDEHCLLGRQGTWPERRFSTIAGFVEPGEALEDAVRREVAEETNIRVAHCHYVASQPWPFPAALMIGFHAQGVTGEIRTNDGELAQARWFSRADLASGDVVLPPRASVAWQLIEAWFDAVPGPGLASFHQRDSEFLRRRAETG